MDISVTNVGNGYLIRIKEYAYVVPTRKYVRAIETEFRMTGKTPTDIIDKAIEILREEGCRQSFQLAHEVGTNPKDFIIFKQVEPKAANVLKMRDYGGQINTFLRGTWKDEEGFDHRPESPRPIGIKTVTEVPVIFGG